MTSDDLLGDDRGDDSLVEGEEDNVEFHTDDQQFEVLDSAEGKGQAHKREKVPPKEPPEQEGVYCLYCSLEALLSKCLKGKSTDL